MFLNCRQCGLELGGFNPLTDNAYFLHLKYSFRCPLVFNWLINIDMPWDIYMDLEINEKSKAYIIKFPKPKYTKGYSRFNVIIRSLLEKYDDNWNIFPLIKYVRYNCFNDIWLQKLENDKNVYDFNYESYNNWPRNLESLIPALIRAGLVAIENSAIEDDTFCEYCMRSFGNWTTYTCPLKRHFRKSPNCRFIRRIPPILVEMCNTDKCDCVERTKVAPIKFDDVLPPPSPDEYTLCGICNAKPRNIVFDCMHCYVCEICVLKLERCPICRCTGAKKKIYFN